MAQPPPFRFEPMLVPRRHDCPKGTRYHVPLPDNHLLQPLGYRIRPNAVWYVGAIQDCRLILARTGVPLPSKFDLADLELVEHPVLSLFTPRCTKAHPNTPFSPLGNPVW